MKERPILFSAPMVNAILAGNKTQTRRIAKPRKRPSLLDGQWSDSYVLHPENVEWLMLDNPYGQPGDRLWVREAWAEVGTCDPGLIIYRSDYPACVPNGFENVPPSSDITWKPSIHMFRRHSRISLEIVSVRVERLQEISEADSIAEGTPVPCGGWIGGYKNLWESINGAGSWDANPFVWVVEFRRI